MKLTIEDAFHEAVNGAITSDISEAFGIVDESLGERINIGGASGAAASLEASVLGSVLGTLLGALAKLTIEHFHQVPVDFAAHCKGWMKERKERKVFKEEEKKRKKRRKNKIP